MDETPRLFWLRRDGALIADGVHWPDGMITVRWTVPELGTDTWSSFDDPAAAIVHTDEVTVVWRRQDTYADPAPAEAKEPLGG